MNEARDTACRNYIQRSDYDLSTRDAVVTKNAFNAGWKARKQSQYAALKKIATTPSACAGSEMQSIARDELGILG